MQKIVQNKKKTVFGPKMSYLSILGCRFEQLLSYFQHSRICQNRKFRTKLKILNFGIKNCLIKVFLGCNLKKNYCHIWNQQPLICHLDVFKQYSEFWHWVLLFNRSGVRFFLRSTFSKGAHYKVWHLMVNTRDVFRTQSNIYDNSFQL